MCDCYCNPPYSSIVDGYITAGINYPFDPILNPARYEMTQRNAWNVSVGPWRDLQMAHLLDKLLPSERDNPCLPDNQRPVYRYSRSYRKGNCDYGSCHCCRRKK